MKYALSPGGRATIERLATAKFLLAFDYDGTLAPIVASRERARMRAATRELLRKVTALYPCIVLSGRSVSDVTARLGGVELAAVCGNHGAEPSAGASRLERQVSRWIPLLEARLSGLPGVELENKRFSVAVHYRSARAKGPARRAILEAATSLGAVRLVGGKQVVNVLPAGAPDKGSALSRLSRRIGCDAVLYVGDDDTDEDVFKLNGRDPSFRSRQLITIRVGSKRSSLARYYLRSQLEVDELLRTLVDLRTAR
jgi:trehalose 6-phosphate phosphatase